MKKSTKTGSPKTMDNTVGERSEIKAEALRLKEERFEHIIKGIEDYAIFLLDLEGTIVNWNKGGVKIMGYSNDEIIGKNIRIFYSHEDKDVHLPQNALETAYKNGSINHEGWRIKKNGSRFWASDSIIAIRNDKGIVSGFLEMIRDYTTRKIAEDNISNYTEHLKQKNEELRQSEDRYHRMITEVKDYAIILLDINGKILDWNKGAEKLKGYQTSEIIGKSFKLFYTKEDKETNLPFTLLKEAQTNGSVNHEGWRIRKDGTRFWGNVVITALHDDAGQHTGFIKVTKDLTERKKAEDRINNVNEDLKQKNEQLRRSEEQYNRMIAEVQDYAIILLNPSGYIQNWNTGAQLIKGYTPAEIIGKNFRVFYSEKDQESKLPEKLLEIAHNNGKAVHEGWRVRKDGTKFWGSIVITALHDAQRNVIGFSKVTRDLTERKSNEDALKKSAEQLQIKNHELEHLNSELTSFAYVVSHDLKEPLRKISIFSSRLSEMKSLPERAEEFIEKISSSALRMQKLIEDLLSYSRITNTKDKFKRIDLNETVESVKGDLEVIIKETQATIQLPTLPIIDGLSFQLHQLFLNLISNALKFSKEGISPVIQIMCRKVRGIETEQLRADVTAEYYEVSIKDNGIGFDPHYANKIFEVFERLNPESSASGTGIGLAIAKKVMENHHGKIAAQSTPGEGATFYLYFPVDIKEELFIIPQSS